MKKCLPIIIIISILVLVMQIFANHFIKERHSEYVLKTDDGDYKVNESLTVIDNIQYYDFSIDVKDENYAFTFVNDLNKQSEVIKNIKYYKEGDLSCITPVYKRDIIGDIICLQNGQQVSYSYLKQVNNGHIDSIISKLKDEGISNKKWESNTVVPSTLQLDGRKIDVYQENILENYSFIIWRYRGIYLLKSEDSVIKDYLGHDQYKNEYSALVGKYYVSADPNVEGGRISELSYYNVKDMGKGKIYFDESTSNNYYFNGVFDEKLYFTDIGSEKQYSIDPKFEKIELVGSKEKDFLVADGDKLVSKSAAEFLSGKFYFIDSVINEEISSKYSNVVDIKKVRKFYYFRTSDGNIYKAHEDRLDKSELILKFNNLTEWVVKNGDIMVVAGDMIYFYTEENGLLPLAKNSELNYNHYNICDFYEY